MVPNRPQWLVSDKARSCDMYLFTLKLPKSFQVPFNPFSGSCLSKMRVDTWDEELYI